MGGPIKRKKREYGPLSGAVEIIRQVGSGIIQGAAEAVLLDLAVALFPQFAFAIYAGYTMYKYGSKALALKREYDSVEGTPEDKIVHVAVEEGFKAGVSAITNETVGSQVHSLVKQSVHTTAERLAENDKFDMVARAAGSTSPTAGEDLEYFFTNTAVDVVEGMYKGGTDAIADYIAGKVLP